MIMHRLISISITLLVTSLLSFKVVDAQFICYICGDSKATFNPDIVLESPVTCEQLQELGLGGGIDEETCTILIEEENVPELCECSNVAAPTTPVSAPVNAPVPVPVPVPVDVPVPVPVETPVLATVPVAPTVGGMGMNNNQVMAMGMGMGMDIGSNIGGMGMMALLRYARN